jgi:hypothetical protein
MCVCFSEHLTTYCDSEGMSGMDTTLQVNALTSIVPNLSDLSSPISSHHLPFIRGVQSDPEGALWRDPPNYWEQIVWPAYIEAHKHVFENGNWEGGASSGKVEDLLIIDELEAGMTRAVDEVCERMKQVVYSK